MRLEFEAFGWGATATEDLTNHLMNQRLPFVPNDDCAKSWTQIDSDYHLCAGMTYPRGKARGKVLQHVTTHKVYYNLRLGGSL